jgi:uncharacterized membrane protein YkvA (DUF1232 family)
MAKLVDISKMSLKSSFTKRRTTFWQMMRAIYQFKYKPSWLLILTILGAGIYVFSPLSMFSEQHYCIRYIDDAFIIFVVLKVLSHETLRYSRFKARERRF